MRCKYCTTTFTRKYSLTRHVQKFHPANWDVFQQQLEQHEKEKFAFHCHCGKRFNSESNYKYHLSSHDASPHQKLLICPECRSGIESKSILKHFEDVHKILIEKESKTFSSFHEFEQWREDYENKFKVSFTRNTGKKKLKNFSSMIIFECNRTGHFSSKSKQLRNLKRGGSIKINGYCPASLHVTITPNNGVTCVVTHTHIGHENELRCCRLRKKDREEISRKIKMGVDFDQILNDVKGSFDKEMERIHLLKKKDLHNISREFQDSSNKSKDDYEVTSALVDELEPPVEYFEAQNLDVNDFTNTPNQTIIISNIDEHTYTQEFGQLILKNDNNVELSLEDSRNCVLERCRSLIQSANEEQLEIFTLNLDNIETLFGSPERNCEVVSPQIKLELKKDDSSPQNDEVVYKYINMAEIEDEDHNIIIVS